LQNKLNLTNPSNPDFAIANPEAVVHPTVRIWAGSVVRERAELGENTTLGRDCYVGPGVKIGKNCKVQNQALIYEPCVIGDGVFIGPRVVITNDLNPRAVTSDGVLKTPLDWTSKAATIESGASLGAGVITVAGVKIGKWAMIAAGAVVTTDVPDHALFAGVPARQIGWVSEEGFKLEALESDLFRCPSSGKLFRLIDKGSIVQQ
jgi:UDP-2-acetamido-3-amino-2,3-dideoxy-glucuronate N-acetyltransferase